ncbi:MAG: hypothetical protein PHC41_10280 [Lachnospiraceae bacterium]|nr:hypothetical protein [Lachnospiraceae bacterium]MDD3616597.1 hypothetical protein [Lachnospiraceae bacterium]
MNDYIITFGTELSDEQLDKIEMYGHIPAKIGSVYINAKSPWHAMRIFKKKYGIKKVLFHTRNPLKQVYIVRPITCDSYVAFRVWGLKWSRDFTMLI